MRFGKKKFKKLCFSLFCSRLALYLDNIGCGSAKKFKKLCFSLFFALTFHYICKNAKNEYN